MTSKAWLSFGKINKEWIYICVNGITLGKMTWNWIIFMLIPRITDITGQALFVKHGRRSTWNGLFSQLIHICLQQSLTIWHGLDSTSWTWSTSRNPEITQNNNYYVHSSNYYTPGEGVRIKYNQWGWLFVFYNVSAAFQPYNRGKKYYWCLVPK